MIIWWNFIKYGGYQDPKCMRKIDIVPDQNVSKNFIYITTGIFYWKKGRDIVFNLFYTCTGGALVRAVRLTTDCSGGEKAHQTNCNIDFAITLHFTSFRRGLYQTHRLQFVNKVLFLPFTLLRIKPFLECIHTS